MDVDLIEATQQLRNDWLTQRIENLNSVDASIDLGEFLQLDKKEDKQSNVIFEQFLQAARRTTELCSEQK